MELPVNIEMEIQTTNQGGPTDSKSWMDIALEILKYTRSVEKPELDHIRKEWQLFYGTFPEVANYMVSLRAFSKKAFDLTVKKKDTMPRKPEYFWKLQAFYARELYKAKTPHWRANVAKEIYTQTYENYRKQFDKVQGERTELEKEREEREKQYATDRRRELMAFVGQMSTASADNTVDILVGACGPAGLPPPSPSYSTE